MGAQGERHVDMKAEAWGRHLQAEDHGRVPGSPPELGESLGIDRFCPTPSEGPWLSRYHDLKTSALQNCLKPLVYGTLLQETSTE